MGCLARGRRQLWRKCVPGGIFGISFMARTSLRSLLRLNVVSSVACSDRLRTITNDAVARELATFIYLQLFNPCSRKGPGPAGASFGWTNCCIREGALSEVMGRDGVSESALRSL